MTYGSPEFDWDVLTRPDVASLLAGQLGFSWLDLHEHLRDLPDDEYFWKPAPWALSIAPRSKTSRRTAGAGEWVVEWPDGPDDPGPRTIAWLVSHLVEVFAERWEWTFGGRTRRRDDLVLAHPSASAGVAALAAAVGAWRAGHRGADRRRAVDRRRAARPPRSTSRPRSPTSCCTSTASSSTTARRSPCCATSTGRAPRRRRPSDRW